MDFTEQTQNIETLRARRQDLDQQLQTATAECNAKADAVFKQAWAARFPKHMCRALASSTDARVYLYSVKKDWRGHVAFLEGGGWGVKDEDDDHQHGVPVEGPFPFAELEQFIEDIQTENPGLIIELATLKVRESVDPDCIGTFREIQLLHPDQEVVLVGESKKWHVGWDIADKIIRVTLDGVNWVWWSTDAHGGPLLHKAMEGTPEWDAFVAWESSDR